MHNRAKQLLKYKTGTCTGWIYRCQGALFRPQSIHCMYPRWESSCQWCRVLEGRSEIKFKIGGGVNSCSQMLHWLCSIVAMFSGGFRRSGAGGHMPLFVCVNWGEPERAPHLREGWELCLYVYNIYTSVIPYILNQRKQ